MSNVIPDHPPGRRRSTAAASIIGVRGPRAAWENSSHAASNRSRRVSIGCKPNHTYLRHGLRCFPLSRRVEPPTLRPDHGLALRRGTAEKRQDAIHLQPARGANLCPHAVSPCRLRTLLVLAAPYRATHRHLNGGVNASLSVLSDPLASFAVKGSLPPPPSTSRI